MSRLSERWLRRWSRCVSWLRHHRLKECGLKLNTLGLEWMNVKLKLSLLKASLRVYSTLHLSYLSFLIYSRMHLSLSLGLYWWSLCSPNPGTIGSLLKFYPPQRMLIICVINVRGLKICFSAQIDPDILEHSSEERSMILCASSLDTPCESVSQSEWNP